ncbi:unnamed protein product [Anisakis simplex]|uniref:Uncharacterized protein n=1 Tax=Anisakis simplex TaxID=6269 RepID=A0A0M3JNH7_ANISI|nr:unnamed protein product [Anisakis simplex]
MYAISALKLAGSGHWEVESSSSASEIERKPGGSENPTGLSRSI